MRLTQKNFNELIEGLKRLARHFEKKKVSNNEKELTDTFIP